MTEVSIGSEARNTSRRPAEGETEIYFTFTSRGLKKRFFFFFFGSPHGVMVVSRSFPLLFSKLTSLVVFSKTASSFPPLLCFPRPLRVYFPCCIFQDGFKQDLVTSPEVYSKNPSSLLPLLCFPRLLETSVQCLQREFHAYCFCCFQNLFHARLLC